MKLFILTSSLLIFFYCAAGQKPVSEMEIKYNYTHDCRAKDATNIKGNKPTWTDTRFLTHEGRNQIVNEAWKNIWDYVEACGNDLGLNYVLTYESYKMFRDQNKYLKRSYISGHHLLGSYKSLTVRIDIDYVKIQEKVSVAGKNDFNFSEMKFDETGFVYNGAFYSSAKYKKPRPYTLEELESIDPIDVNPYEGDHFAGDSYQQINSRIVIYPLIFEMRGLYLESESDWAETPVEAVEFIILHELGHLSCHIQDRQKIFTGYFPKIECTEAACDYFATSVWRCQD